MIEVTTKWRSQRRHMLAGDNNMLAGDNKVALTAQHSGELAPPPKS